MPLEPGRGQPHGQADDEERRQRDDVFSVDRAPFPPQDQQYRGRKRGGHRLAEQGAGEQRQTRDPPRFSGRAGRAPAAEAEEPQEAPRGGEVEHGRQHVLSLGHPRDRLHVNRVKGKDRRREPGTRHLQFA